MPPRKFLSRAARPRRICLLLRFHLGRVIPNSKKVVTVLISKFPPAGKTIEQYFQDLRIVTIQKLEINSESLTQTTNTPNLFSKIGKIFDMNKIGLL